jgi:hypothetical protein
MHLPLNIEQGTGMACTLFSCHLTDRRGVLDATLVPLIVQAAGQLQC